MGAIMTKNRVEWCVRLTRKTCQSAHSPRCSTFKTGT
jgi:hypothetical protein